MAQVAAVLAAAGAGVRFRKELASAPADDSRRLLPKTFLPLTGRPIWAHGAQALQACAVVDAIAVVTPADWIDEVRATCDRLALHKVCAVVAGGERRQDSVHNALLALGDDPPGVVAVHDGARPLASVGLISRCIDSALERGSGVAAVPVTDTLKRADADGRVEDTLDRRLVWAMQTPQAFGYAALLAAHEAALRDGAEVTDDAALIERMGAEVWLVRGETTNLKITTPADLELAARLLAGAGGGAMRVGHGFDAHRLASGRPCVLGGVTIPHDRGPLGHSDGDVLTHAIMDAALGALALGDIGRHFPDTDSTYAGARSVELAAHVANLLRERGYRIANLDATLVAQSPKIAPYVPAMREALAAAFDCPLDSVSVKGTTTEGLGFTGSGEGIAAHAVLALEPVSAG
jgi:2-C-methyl-D-erythritol 4-phosphate cytidylyltransferase/2-C-methyl-D-erythritol 2,4-cyclodiphosphate synthase